MFGGSVFAGLFAAAFLAATIVPFSSEVVLATALTTSGQPWIALIIRVKRENLARAESWYHRWGRWSLLLSWAPVIGDPLTVVAGFLREPLWFFIPVVIVAKAGRYLAVAAITAGLI